jgi:tRNA(Ile)-lysidine synthase
MNMNLPDDFNPELFRVRLQRFVEQENLFHDRQPLLLAISGGLDSIVLSHILHSLHFNLVMAHCNFGLRGSESDADEAFVKDWGQFMGIEVHTVCFDTETYRQTKRLSIQAAARALRYQWLEELRLKLSEPDKSQCYRLLTAHHLDDNIETMLLNFFRGTGITGMRGMLPGTPTVARPLLFARREELESYARTYGLTWREDQSNAEDKYDRNFLRHRVIPLLAERFPAIRENLGSNLHRFRDIEKISSKSLEAVVRKLVNTDAAGLARIPVEGLRKTGFPESLLWEVTKDKGFSTGQVAEIVRLMDLPSGKWVASESHRVVRHRNWLLIHPLQQAMTPLFTLESAEGMILFPQGSLEWSCIDYTGEQFPRDAQSVWLDLNDVRFPLILRKWSKGDYFYPFGLGKKKKLARFLIDEKTSLPEKEKTWVLESDKRILWVMGKRIDGRFQVTPASSRILCLKFMRHD